MITSVITHLTDADTETHTHKHTHKHRHTLTFKYLRSTYTNIHLFLCQLFFIWLLHTPLSHAHKQARPAVDLACNDAPKRVWHNTLNARKQHRSDLGKFFSLLLLACGSSRKIVTQGSWFYTLSFFIVRFIHLPGPVCESRVRPLHSQKSTGFARPILSGKKMERDDFIIGGIFLSY